MKSLGRWTVQRELHEQIEGAWRKTGTEEVTVEVFGDIDKLGTRLAHQAAHNTRGEATLVSGVFRAKVLNRVRPA